MRIIVRNLYYNRVFRYFIAAGVATVVDIVVYYTMLHYVFQLRDYTITDYLSISAPSLSLFISYTCGLFTNFVISKYFVFGESKVNGQTQFTRFVGVALLVLFLNYCLMSLLIQRLDWYPTVARIFSALSLGVVSYLFHRMYTFTVARRMLKK